MNLDGRRIGFLGGASSVDKRYRISRNLDWFPEENITREDIEKFDNVDLIDILITHCPPRRIISRNFNPNDLLFFGLPNTWEDPNSILVEQLWDRLGNPKLYSGHMHRSVIDGNARILDINELIFV
jgi:hypothetical protein